MWWRCRARWVGLRGYLLGRLNQWLRIILDVRLTAVVLAVAEKESWNDGDRVWGIGVLASSVLG